MKFEPVTDHLDLWRGIDDAVWRETSRAWLPDVTAARTLPPAIARAARRLELPVASMPLPVARKVPEPV